MEREAPQMTQQPTTDRKVAPRRGLGRDATVAALCGVFVALMVGAAGC